MSKPMVLGRRSTSQSTTLPTDQRSFIEASFCLSDDLRPKGLCDSTLAATPRHSRCLVGRELCWQLPRHDLSRRHRSLLGRMTFQTATAWLVDVTMSRCYTSRCCKGRYGRLYLPHWEAWRIYICLHQVTPVELWFTSTPLFTDAYDMSDHE